MNLGEIVLSEISVSYGPPYIVFYWGKNLEGDKANCLIIPDESPIRIQSSAEEQKSSVTYEVCLIDGNLVGFSQRSRALNWWAFWDDESLFQELTAQQCHDVEDASQMTLAVMRYIKGQWNIPSKVKAVIRLEGSISRSFQSVYHCRNCCSYTSCECSLQELTVDNCVAHFWVLFISYLQCCY